VRIPGDFQNRNLGPNLQNQVNPIYFFPPDEENVSPFIDASAGFSEFSEGVNYSDCEELVVAQISDQHVLADFVPIYEPA